MLAVKLKTIKNRKFLKKQKATFHDAKFEEEKIFSCAVFEGYHDGLNLFCISFGNICEKSFAVTKFLYFLNVDNITQCQLFQRN